MEWIIGAYYKYVSLLWVHARLARLVVDVIAYTTLIKVMSKVASLTEMPRSNKLLQYMKIFISSEWIYPIAKETENNKLSNLTININILTVKIHIAAGTYRVRLRISTARRILFIRHSRPEIPLPPNCPSSAGSGPPPNTWFLGSPESSPYPNSQRGVNQFL